MTQLKGLNSEMSIPIALQIDGERNDSIVRKYQEAEENIFRHYQRWCPS
jgi:hypothetical protein